MPDHRPLGDRRRSQRTRPPATCRPRGMWHRLRAGRRLLDEGENQPRPHCCPRGHRRRPTARHGLAAAQRRQRREGAAVLRLGLDPHRHRQPPPADPTQPDHRRTRLLPMLVTHSWAPARHTHHARPGLPDLPRRRRSPQTACRYAPLRPQPRSEHADRPGNPPPARRCVHLTSRQRGQAAALVHLAPTPPGNSPTQSPPTNRRRPIVQQSRNTPMQRMHSLLGWPFPIAPQRSMRLFYRQIGEAHQQPARPPQLRHQPAQRAKSNWR